MSINNKFRVIPSSKITPAKGFLFWVLVALLPLITGKAIVNFYSNQMRDKIRYESHVKLKTDISQFNRNIDMGYFIQNSMIEFKKNMLNENYLNSKLIKEKIIKFTSESFGCTPTLLISSNDKFNKAFIYNTYSQTHVGNRAALNCVEIYKNDSKNR